MTLIVHFPPDHLARLQAEADRTSLSHSDYVRRLHSSSSLRTADVAAHQSAVDAVLDALAGRGIFSDDFIGEKQTEIARDEAHGQEHFASRIIAWEQRFRTPMTL